MENRSHQHLFSVVAEGHLTVLTWADAATREPGPADPDRPLSHWSCRSPKDDGENHAAVRPPSPSPSDCGSPQPCLSRCGAQRLFIFLFSSASVVKLSSSCCEFHPNMTAIFVSSPTGHAGFYFLSSVHCDQGHFVPRRRRLKMPRKPYGFRSGAE